MRYKVVPEPRSVEFLTEARSALPLIPGSVEDCCTRIRDETDLQSRDVAREYLTLLQALGLAAETDRGYHRTKGTLDEDELAANFRERVFGAREVLDALEGGPASVDEVFGELREEIPRWERDRHTDWEAEWRDRTARLLEWARVFGLVEKSDEETFRLC